MRGGRGSDVGGKYYLARHSQHHERGRKILPRLIKDVLGAVKTLKYVDATKGLGLRYSVNGDPITCICLTLPMLLVTKIDGWSCGSAVVYAGAVIACFSKMQRCVTLSSSKVDFIAFHGCVKEERFLRQVLEVLRPDAQVLGIKVSEDINGVIQLARYPAISGRTKHTYIQHHFLRTICR